MDWYETVIDVIDLRSFSNLWFWIALAVMWSSTSHWVLGVPYDMITRARRIGGQAEIDLEDMVRINTNRLLYIGRVAGLWLLFITCFTLTVLIVAGFWYGVEFAQAVFLLFFPMSIVGLLSLNTAKIIQETGVTGEDMHKRLFRHRIWTQVVGMISIFVTSMWGMYQNLALGPWG